MRKLSLVLVLLSSCLWFGVSFGDPLMTREEVVAKTMEWAFSWPYSLFASRFSETDFEFIRATHVDPSKFSNWLAESPDYWTVEFEFREAGGPRVYVGKCDLHIQNLNDLTDGSKHSFQIPDCTARDPKTGDKVFQDVFQGYLGSKASYYGEEKKDVFGWPIADGVVSVYVYLGGGIQIKGRSVVEAWQPNVVLNYDFRLPTLIK